MDGTANECRFVMRSKLVPAIIATAIQLSSVVINVLLTYLLTANRTETAVFYFSFS